MTKHNAYALGPKTRQPSSAKNTPALVHLHRAEHQDILNTQETVVPGTATASF
jgi:hypothetical protein